MELYAHSVGVIRDTRVEFGVGFTVLTGETGAGKTLLLDALGLCLGVTPDATRGLAQDTRAAAVFVDREGREVALTRESASGRLRSAIDGVTTSASALRARAEELIVIHGQHDSLALRNRALVRSLVDRSGGVDTTELDALRTRLRDAVELRASLGGDDAARQHELDLVNFQIGELEAAQMTSDDDLADALDELARVSELREAQVALARLSADLDDDEQGVLSALARVIAQLPSGRSVDAVRDVLDGALTQAREGSRELARLLDPDAVDQALIDQLDRRVAVLQAVARKYGGTIAAAREQLQALRARRDLAHELAERSRGLDHEIEEIAGRERVVARQVREARADAARRLNAAIAAQLPRVALEGATLRFDVDGEDGSRIELLFAGNPGSAPGPLSSIASGGELSRVLLALSLETVHDDVVAVFDEIDAGLGGQVAQQIGECLAELGAQQQVLAVTHLASVAARADHHFTVEKRVTHTGVAATVREVRGEQRVEEIARMLAGDRLSEESRALARRLLAR
ncbi:MAG: AAA family ATPase [Acidimicrobiales bacterium]